MKRLSILGVTGSIGTQTVDVCLQHPDLFEIVAISAGHNINVLEDLLAKIKPELISVSEESDCLYLSKKYPYLHFVFGEDGLFEVATYEKCNWVVNALVGFVGLKPTLKAIKAGKNIALANKETLVVAGELVKKAIKEYNVELLPIDSEHSAILQCLRGNNKKDVKRLLITASGGSFRNKTRDELLNVTKEEALNHPNWSMGAKITIDSATMMNKGFEVIEAHFLFDLDYDDIDVVMHQESVIHSMVEYQDGAVIAQLGSPDMRLPIQYALSYPNRFELNEKPFDITDFNTLHFSKPDFKRFPLLELAYKVGRLGGNLPAVMNAANEVAVGLFLKGKIKFLDIETLIFDTLENIKYVKDCSLNDLIESDRLAREYVLRKVN